MSLRKQLAIRERSRLIFRTEWFNPLNIPMLGLLDLDVTAGTFGVIRISNSDYNPRSLQISLRLEI